MPATTNFYFRPTSITISEHSYGETPTYRIHALVSFFYDEEMTKPSHNREFDFENVTLNPSWETSLGDVYSLILKNL